MPIIPRVDSQARQLDRMNLSRRGANVTEAGLLGNQADNLDAISKGAKDLAGVAFKVQEQRDFDAIQKVDIQRRVAESEYLNLTKNRSGENAFDSISRTKEWIDGNGKGRDDEALDLPESLSYREAYDSLTDRQREQFDKIRDKRVPILYEQAAAHEAGQRNIVVDARHKAKLETIIDGAAGSTEPAHINTAYEELRREMQVYRAVKGWEQETYDSNVLTATDAFHRRLLNKYLDLPNGDEAAREYFKSISSGDIKDSTRDEFKKIIEERGFLGKVQRKVDEIATTVEGDDKQIEAARKIADPEVRKDVVAGIIARQTRDAAAVQRVRTKNSEALYKMVESGEVTAVADLPRDLYESQTIAGKKLIKTAIENGGKLPDVETDLDVFQAVMEQIKTDPDTFKDRHLKGELGDKLSKADLRKFAIIQSEIRTATPAQAQIKASRAEMRTAALGSLTGDDAAAIKHKIESAIIDGEIAWAEENPGKEMSDIAYNELLRSSKARFMPLIQAHFNQARKEKRRIEEEKLEEKRRKFASGGPTIQQKMAARFKDDDFAGSDNLAKRGVIEREVLARVSAFRAATGEAMPDSRADEVLRTVFEDVVQLPRTLLPNLDKFEYELTDEERAEAFVEFDLEKGMFNDKEVRVKLSEIDALPRQTLVKVRTALRDAGKALTYHNFAEMWVKNFGGKGNK